MWTEPQESRRQQYIELLIQWQQAVKNAVHMADDKGIVISAESGEFLQPWADYRASLNLPKFNTFSGLETGTRNISSYGCWYAAGLCREHTVSGRWAMQWT